MWAPLAVEEGVAGALIAVDPGAFHGAVQATTLKVAGVDVYSGGDSAGAAPAGHDEVVLSDTRRGINGRVVLDGDRLAGGELVGDAAAARRLTELLRTGDDVPEELLAPGGPPPKPIGSDPSATVCSCNDVTVGEVQAAIRRDGLTTLAQVGARTRATTGCGGCGADVQELLAAATAPS